MKAGGGKQKGAAWERRCCKDLSLWVSHGKRTDIFWRAAMSGGRATIQHRQKIDNVTQVGDISSIDPLGAPLIRAFVFECKHVKDIGFTPALFSRSGLFVEFWTTLCSAAAGVNRQPVLLLLQNQRQPLFVTSARGDDRLRLNHLPLHGALCPDDRWPVAYVHAYRDVFKLVRYRHPK